MERWTRRGRILTASVLVAAAVVWVAASESGDSAVVRAESPSTLTVGREHACAILVDGTIECWGSNARGQLGDGTTTDRFVPVAVSGLTDVVDVSAGAQHTCAVKSNGTAWCWGANNFGALGTGGLGSDAPTPQQVVGLTDIVDITAGNVHTCAIDDGGDAWCWGQNGSGELGKGTTGSAEGSPQAVDTASDYVAISAGDFWACAVVADGTLECWGNSAFDNFGNGGGSNLPDQPSPLPRPGVTDAVDVGVGSSHACVLSDDRTVDCWGLNSAGQVGVGASELKISDPTPVVGLADATQISIGDSHSCARLGDATVQCWGSNLYGGLGTGDTVDSTVPLAIPGLTLARAVAAGGLTTCVLRVNGVVRCVGQNEFGEVGRPPTSVIDTPAAIDGVSATSVATSGGHTCVERSDQTVQCWGDNRDGQVGNGTTSSAVLAPTTVGAISTATDVAVGGAHSCALLADETVRCWGWNANGSIGTGQLGGYYPDPQTVVSLTGVSRIVAGTATTCALLNGQTVECWGDGGFGQLGAGVTLDSASPLAVSGLTAVDDLDVNTSHACAAASGSAWCWGLNFAGKLGDGTTTQRSTPVEVAGLTDVAQVGIGEDHSCALKTDGTVWCWGSNLYGQLGDGTSLDSLSPVQVTGLGSYTVIDLTGGADHMCALASTGEVLCWGRNEVGQLGDGTTANRQTPGLVSGITTADQFDVALNAACAHLTTDEIVCWGSNPYGAVGDPPWETSPQTVLLSDDVLPPPTTTSTTSSTSTSTTSSTTTSSTTSTTSTSTTSTSTTSSTIPSSTTTSTSTTSTSTSTSTTSTSTSTSTTSTSTSTSTTSTSTPSTTTSSTTTSTSTTSTTSTSTTSTSTTSPTTSTTSTTTSVPAGTSSTSSTSTTTSTTPPATAAATTTTTIGGGPGPLTLPREIVVPIDPARLLDTRAGFQTIDGRFQGTGTQPGGTALRVDIAGRAGIPDDARAIVANVTAVEPISRGFVTVHPCLAALPNAASLNYPAGVNLGNEIIAELDGGGDVCIYTHRDAHLTLDVVGYLPASSPYVAVAPARLVDTRSGFDTIDDRFAAGGRRPATTTYEVVVAGRAGVPADAAAAALYVTSVDADRNGYVTVHPCSPSTPNAASLNHLAGSARGNELIAPLDGDGNVCVYTHQTTDITVDVVGYLPVADRYTALTPARLLETRPAFDTADGRARGGGRTAAGETTVLQVAGRAGVPTSATAVVANVTAVVPSANGYVTAHPCLPSPPNASSLNHVAGVTGGNEIVAELDSAGRICLYTHRATDLTVDVSGYLE